MTTYTVTAKRWEHGWELHIGGVGVTQSRGLGDAERMARGYIEALTDAAPGSFEVTIVHEVPEAADDLAALDLEYAEARRAEEVAARRRRAIARKLRQAGYTGSDIARVLGVSKQRVSQLTKAS